MAYNKRYNPDALPAFAEPERNNSTSGSSSPRPQPASKPPSSRVDGDRYSSKPSASASGNVHTLRDDSASARRQNSQQSYRTEQRPPPGGYESRYDDRRYPGPGSGSRHNSYDNAGYNANRRREEGRHDDRYGSGPPPPPPGGGRDRNSTGSSMRTPQDGNDRDPLWSMFKAVDRDQTGQLSEEELGRALVNGDYTSFDHHTVRMMIRYTKA
ncbi:MAG: hypothetical protein Q9162_000775 [Coniocarpon cinnabarinum]